MPTVGDIIRYKAAFVNRHNGLIPDICGEVIAHTKLVAKVRWDDDREASVLFANLELANKPVPASTYSTAYTDELRMTRAALLATASEEVKEAWNNAT